MTDTHQPPSTSPLFAVFAALSQELEPLKRRKHSSLVLIKTGIGTENAARRVHSFLQQQQVRAGLGIGFAGGLSPSLQVGDLVIVRQVRESFNSAPSLELLAAAEKVHIDGVAVRFGTAITVNEIVCKAETKGLLARTLDASETGCVDMESSAIVQVCSEHQVPFLIIRCITDKLDENLPLNFNRYRQPDGNMNSKKVVLAAIARPRALIGLWEWRRRSQQCAENLALFVERLLLN